MKNLLTFCFVWLLSAMAVFGQGLAGVQRNPWTTNPPAASPGVAVQGLNNLMVTNVGSGTSWWFYAVRPETVARLLDVTNIIGAISAGTNALVQTNGVDVGSIGTLNFNAGVTGFVSGSVVTVGVSSAGGGGDQVWTNDSGSVYIINDPDIINFSSSLVNGRGNSWRFQNASATDNWLTFSNSLGYPTLPLGVDIGGDGGVRSVFFDSAGNIYGGIVGGANYWFIENGGNAMFASNKFVIATSGRTTISEQLTVQSNANISSALNLTNGPGAGNPILRLWSTNGQGFTAFTSSNNWKPTNTFIFSVTNPLAGQILKFDSVTYNANGNAQIVLTNDTDSTGGGDAGGTNARQFGTLVLTNLSGNPIPYTNIIVADVGIQLGTNSGITYITNISAPFFTNWVNAVSNLVNTKQHGSESLTNLSGNPIPFTNIIAAADGIALGTNGGITYITNTASPGGGDTIWTNDALFVKPISFTTNLNIRNSDGSLFNGNGVDDMIFFRGYGGITNTNRFFPLWSLSDTNQSTNWSFSIGKVSDSNGVFGVMNVDGKYFPAGGHQVSLDLYASSLANETHIFMATSNGASPGSGALFLMDTPSGNDITMRAAPNNTSFNLGGLFVVTNNGNLAAVRGVSYSWPTANAIGAMTNDGAGNLGWWVVPPSSGGDSLWTNAVIAHSGTATFRIAYPTNFFITTNGAIWSGNGSTQALVGLGPGTPYGFFNYRDWTKDSNDIGGSINSKQMLLYATNGQGSTALWESYLDYDSQDVVSGNFLDVYAKSNGVTVGLVGLDITPSGSTFQTRSFGNTMFFVDEQGDTSMGNLQAIRGLAYSWPLSHGVGALTNDNAGNLGWYAYQPPSTTLSNLSGTGAITNIFSPTLSNATIKPLVVGVGNAAGATNTTGEIRGIEAGTGITLTPNGSNYVIASTATGGGITTNANQFAASVELAIKSGALLTNTLFWPSNLTGPAIIATASSGQVTNLIEFRDTNGIRSLAVSSNGMSFISYPLYHSNAIAFRTNNISLQLNQKQIFTNAIRTNLVLQITNALEGVTTTLTAYGAGRLGNGITNAWNILCTAPSGTILYWPPGTTNGNFDVLVNSNQVVTFTFIGDFGSSNVLASYLVREGIGAN